MSKAVPQGVVVSLAIVTHEPPPAGRRSKSTWTVSGSEVALRATVPFRYWPGSARVGVGETLSTETLRTADVVVFPAMSATMIWIVAAPSAPVVVFQLRENGALVSVPSSEPRTKNCTEATGDVASEAEAVMATVPVRS